MNNLQGVFLIVGWLSDWDVNTRKRFRFWNILLQFSRKTAEPHRFVCSVFNSWSLIVSEKAVLVYQLHSAASRVYEAHKGKTIWWTTSYQRWCTVITLHLQRYNAISTLCAWWECLMYYLWPTMTFFGFTLSLYIIDSVKI